MSCRTTCVQPTPTNAHCGSCHVTFGGITGFDRHRRGGECLNPRGLGFVCDRNGVWRFPGPDPTKQVAWPQRETEVTA
jgi:hypothetical protein